MRVLIVDDSASLRFMLRILLGDAGMAVEEAASGRAALERLEGPVEGRPDAVVIDQRMPDMAGLEVARRILARGAAPRLFLFTSYIQPDTEAEARDLGITTVVKTDLDRLVALLGGQATSPHVA